MPQSLVNLLVHVVFSIMDRHPFLSDAKLRAEMHGYLGRIVKEKAGVALTVGGVADHVHLLIVLPKAVPICDLVRDLKRASSLWIKERDPSQEDFAWQGGYGAFSVGQTETELVLNYIKNQEEHHKSRSFQDEYRSFLEKYRIAYDERYVWE